MALWIATPRDEGFSAYQRGQQLCENVYPPNTLEAEQWALGWESAHKKIGAPNDPE